MAFLVNGFYTLSSWSFCFEDTLFPPVFCPSAPSCITWNLSLDIALVLEGFGGKLVRLPARARHSSQPVFTVIIYSIPSEQC